MREYFTRLSQVSSTLDENIRRTIDVLLAVPENKADDLLGETVVDFDAELKYLRGQGPDPWPQAQENNPT